MIGRRGRTTDAVGVYNTRMAEHATDKELRDAFRDLTSSECVHFMSEHPRIYFALARWTAQQEIR